MQLTLNNDEFGFETGVYKTNIDAEQGKVTVSGNVDPTTLIKKLNKAGKHAEFWGAPKPNNNQNNKNQNQNQKPGGGGGAHQNPPKGGGGGGSQQTNAQLQKLQQQMKGLGMGDLKMGPQFQGMKMAFKDNNHPQAPKQGGGSKAVKFNVPIDDDLGDDEFDDDDDYDEDDEFDDDDDAFDDDFEDVGKMKPKGPPPNLMMNGGGGGGSGGNPMMNPQIMNAIAQAKAANGGGGGGGGE